MSYRQEDAARGAERDDEQRREQADVERLARDKKPYGARLVTRASASAATSRAPLRVAAGCALLLLATAAGCGGGWSLAALDPVGDVSGGLRMAGYALVGAVLGLTLGALGVGAWTRDMKLARAAAVKLATLPARRFELDLKSCAATERRRLSVIWMSDDSP